MATETLRIVVRADGTAEVQRSLQQIGTSARRAQGSVQLLYTALRAISLTILVKEAIQFADAFTNIQNRLRLVTEGTDELNVVMERLFQISNETRSSFQANAELYNRLRLSTRDLGLSQEETLQITRTLNQAVAAAGLRSQEATNGIIQLSQGLAAGRINGDELRAVLEQLPPVAQLIANEMGVTRGELRKLGSEGKITSEIIVRSLQHGAEQIDKNFKTIVPTIEQSLVVLRNQVIRLIGDFNTWTNSTSILAQLILKLAENLGMIARIAAPLGVALMAALAGPALVAGIMKVIQLLGWMFALMLSNPVTALAAAIGLLVGVIINFGDQITIGTKKLVTLQDLGVVVWDRIVSAIRTAWEYIGNLFGQLFGWAKEWWSQWDFTIEGMLKSTAWFIDKTIGFFKGLWAAVGVVQNASNEQLLGGFIEVINGFIDFAQQILNTMTTMFANLIDFVLTKSIPSLIDGIGKLFNALKDFIPNVFREAMAKAAEIVVGAINTMIDWFNNIPGMHIERIITDPAGAATDAMGELKKTLDGVVDTFDRAKNGEQIFTLPKLDNPYKKDAEELGKNISDAISNGMNSETTVQNWLKDVLRDAETRASDRAMIARLTQPGVVDLNTPGTKNLPSTSGSGMTAKEIEDVHKKLTQLWSELDNPVLADRGRVAELERSQTEQLKIVQEALQARVISEQEAADLIVGIHQTTDRKIGEIETNRYAMQLAAASQTFDSLTSIAKDFAGEQSGVYKAMFAASKAFAIAESVIKIQQAMAQALALPFPANLGAIATIAAQAASIVSNIHAVAANFADGGRVNGPGTSRSDSIPAYLSNGEFVVNADATRRNLDLLEAINGGRVASSPNRYAMGGMVSGSGHSGPSVVINDQRSGGAPITPRNRVGQDGQVYVEVLVQDAVQKMYVRTKRQRSRETLDTIRRGRRVGNI